MANLNKFLGIGNLTAKPELKMTQSGIPVCSFTIAINRKEGTDFIDVVTWRKQAEFVCNYFDKGVSIFVVGSLQSRTWKDKDGKTRKAFEIQAEDVQFAEAKGKQEIKFEEVEMDDQNLPF